MSREVDEDTYYASIRRLGAVQNLDPAVHKPGRIGRIEHWRTPDGAIGAWVGDKVPLIGTGGIASAANAAATLKAGAVAVQLYSR